jgi:hypothetical protein
VRAVARGAHPEDPALFGAAALPALQAATTELSWLLTRGYAERSATALVGDRHGLDKRQRDAVRRCAASTSSLAGRAGRACVAAMLHGHALAIDGFNCLITTEAAIAGAPIFRGYDGALRDIASVHGNWREVASTTAALAVLADALAALRPCEVVWYLDRPVSRSAELGRVLERVATERALPWRAELVFDPDGVLARGHDVVASADAGVLDRCGAWFDLVSYALALAQVPAWIVDLGAAPA